MSVCTSTHQSTSQRAGGPHRELQSMTALRTNRTHWRADAGLVDELLGATGLKLDRWLRDGQAHIVKDGPHRSVYFVDLSAGRFFLKYYKIPDFKAQLQNLFRPCKALLEWHAAQRVIAAGIPTFETVAVGRTMAGPVVGESFLVTRAIDNVDTLHDYVLELTNTNSRSLSPRLRCQLADRLGQLTARLHNHNLIHRDFHPGNLLLRIDPAESMHLWLVDLHAVSRVRRLTHGMIERNLSLLNNFFVRFTSRSDRHRFFRSYWKNRNHSGMNVSLSQSKSLVRRYDTFCRNAAISALAAGDCKWQRPNSRQVLLESAAVDCRGIATVGRDLLARFLDGPSEFIAAHRTDRANQNAGDITIRLDLDGRSADCNVLLPASGGNPPSGNVSGSGFSPSRAWIGGHALRRRSLRTPLPVAYIEADTDDPFASCLILEQSSNVIPLREWLSGDRGHQLSHPNETSVRTGVKRLASEIRWMHESGVDHSELTVDSVFVEPQEIAFEFRHTHAISLSSGMTRGRITAGLTRLYESAQQLRPLRRTHALRFLRTYLAKFAPGEWKAFYREISKGSCKTTQSSADSGHLTGSKYFELQYERRSGTK